MVEPWLKAVIFTRGQATVVARRPAYYRAQSQAGSMHDNMPGQRSIKVHNTYQEASGLLIGIMHFNGPRCPVKYQIYTRMDLSIGPFWCKSNILPQYRAYYSVKLLLSGLKPGNSNFTLEWTKWCHIFALVVNVNIPPNVFLVSI